MHLSLPIVLLASLSMLPLPAQAYFGPVLGLGAIGSLIAVALVGLLSVFSFIYLPLRSWFERLRKRRADDQDQQDRDS